jgi:hypothetical protein
MPGAFSFWGAPDEARAELEASDLDSQLRFTSDYSLPGDFDGEVDCILAFLFSRENIAALAAGIQAVGADGSDDPLLWFAYPKGSSKTLLGGLQSGQRLGSGPGSGLRGSPADRLRRRLVSAAFPAPIEDKQIHPEERNRPVIDGPPVAKGLAVAASLLEILQLDAQGIHRNRQLPQRQRQGDHHGQKAHGE